MSTSRLCPTCQAPMIRWGTYKTAKGLKHRWRCQACQATATARVDTRAKALGALIDHVTGKTVMADHPGRGRSLQRRLAPAWQYWPIAPVCDEVHHVIHVDGIYLARNCVLLIAMSPTHVLGWHLAKAETAASWQDLLCRIAAPDVVVSDGGAGFAKACRAQWPTTRIQRCTFHVQRNVRTCTTKKPRTQAGIELYALSLRLTTIDTLAGQARWIGDYTTWCAKWKTMLAEKTILDTGRVVDTHARLVKARNLLNARLRAGDLFTYLDPTLHEGGPIPAMNNRIENLNGRIRAMLRTHRGWDISRRIKAAMWWCYQHTEYPQPPGMLIHTMPTEDYIRGLYRQAARLERARKGNWGQAIAWAELTWSRNTGQAINQ